MAESGDGGRVLRSDKRWFELHSRVITDRPLCWRQIAYLAVVEATHLCAGVLGLEWKFVAQKAGVI